MLTNAASGSHTPMALPAKSRAWLPCSAAQEAGGRGGGASRALLRCSTGWHRHQHVGSAASLACAEAGHAMPVPRRPQRYLPHRQADEPVAQHASQEGGAPGAVEDLLGGQLQHKGACAGVANVAAATGTQLDTGAQWVPSRSAAGRRGRAAYSLTASGSRRPLGHAGTHPGRRGRRPPPASAPPAAGRRPACSRGQGRQWGGGEGGAERCCAAPHGRMHAHACSSQPASPPHASLPPHQV